jgi:hypothetical protein
MNLLGTIVHAAANTQSFDVIVDPVGIFEMDITAIAGGTPSLVLTILGLNPNNGSTWTILAAAAKTGVGKTQLKVHEDLTASANLIAKDILPRKIRIQSVLTGTAPSATVKFYGHTFVH